MEELLSIVLTQFSAFDVNPGAIMSPGFALHSLPVPVIRQKYVCYQNEDHPCGAGWHNSARAL